MKKISSKIVIAIVAMVVLAIAIVTPISVIISSNVINGEAENRIMNLASSYANEISNITEEIEGNVNALSSHIADSIDIYKANNEEDYLNKKEAELCQTIKSLAESTDGVTGVFFFFDPQLTGNAHDVYYSDDGSGSFKRQQEISESEYNASNESMNWFYEPIKVNRGIWSDPFLWEATKQELVTYSVPVYKDNKLLGVAGIDMKYSDFEATIEGIELYDTGYAFLLNEDYNFVVHPTHTLEENLRTIDNGELAGMSNAIDAADKGYYSYVYKGEKKLMGFAKLTSGKVIVVNATRKEIFKELNKLIIVISIVSIILLTVSSILAIIIGRRISKPIVLVVEHLKVIATGDLTRTIPDEFVAMKDEVGDLAKSVNTMQSSMKNLISEVTESAQVVGATSQQVSATVEEMSSNAQTQSATSEEISSTMEEMGGNIQQVNENIQKAVQDSDKVAQAIDEMDKTVNENVDSLQTVASSTRDITVSINEMNSSINTVADNTQMANQEASSTQTLAQEGKEALDKTINEMDAIQKSMNSLSLVINGLGDSASEIGEIVNVIKDIAEQTNLLALNASIEAARAGEHGRGFAVVAQAIGNLADESSDATKEITNLIKGIQKEVTNAVATTKDGTQTVQAGTNLVRNTAGSLDKIFEAINTTGNLIAEIAATVEQQASGSQEITKAVGGIDEMIQGLMAAMEEMTASSTEIQRAVQATNKLFNELASSMEEQTASTEEVIGSVNEAASGVEQISIGSEEVAKSAEELALKAEDMVRQVKKFKI